MVGILENPKVSIRLIFRLHGAGIKSPTGCHCQHHQRILIVKIILEVNEPEDASLGDIEHFLLFKFMGHEVKQAVLDKFECEESDVQDFEIKR